MSIQSFIELRHDDTTREIADKCNINFKNLSYTLTRQDKNGLRNSNAEMRRTVAQAVEDEANARDQAIADALDDYTPTADLAAVALSGNYNDLSNTPDPLTWTQILNRDTTSETNFVGMQVDISTKREILISDKVDSKYLVKLCLPTADWVTYTLTGGHQVRVKYEAPNLRLSFGTGATWFVYGR